MSDLHKIMPVEKREFKRGDLRPGVDARNLYDFLEPGRKFGDWIKDRLFGVNVRVGGGKRGYNYKKGYDYSVFPQMGKKSGMGRPQDLYILSLRTATNIAILEDNAKGQMVRDYFLDYEEKFNIRVPRKKPYGKRFVMDKNRPTLIERDESIESFNGFSELLGECGNNGFQKRHLVDYMHKGLRDLSASKLRKKWGLKRRVNLRDHSTRSELWKNRMAEAGTAVLIIDNGLNGYEDCVEAVKMSSSFVRGFSGQKLIEE